MQNPLEFEGVNKDYAKYPITSNQMTSQLRILLINLTDYRINRRFIVFC